MFKKVIVSFGTEKFYNAQQRLAKSCKGKGVTHVINWNETMLDEDFKQKNNKIIEQPRGYGYWLWKPYIILKTLDMLDDGDMVFYVDSTNIVLQSLDYVFTHCEKNDIVLFDNRDGNPYGEQWLNENWSKRDCFILMGCDEERYWKGPQINASYQCYKKCENSINFLNQYLKYCENENILTDITNITEENFPNFKDHRHDQSIGSLLAIKYNVDLLPDPSEWGNHLNRPYPQLFWHCRGHL